MNTHLLTSLLLFAAFMPAPLPAAGRRSMTSCLGAFRALSLGCLSKPRPMTIAVATSAGMPYKAMLPVTPVRSFSAPTWWPKPETKERPKYPTIGLSRKMLIDAFMAIQMSQGDFDFIQRTNIIQKLTDAPELTALELLARLNLEIAQHYESQKAAIAAWPATRRIAFLETLTAGHPKVLAQLKRIFAFCYPNNELRTVTITKKDIFSAIINSSHPEQYPALLSSKERTETSGDLARILVTNFEGKQLSVAIFVINIDRAIYHFLFYRQDERSYGYANTTCLRDFIQKLLTAAGQPEAIPEAMNITAMLHPESYTHPDASDTIGDDLLATMILLESDSDVEPTVKADDFDDDDYNW